MSQLLINDYLNDLATLKRVSGAQWLAIQSLLARWPFEKWPSNGADWREFAAVSAPCSAEPLLAAALPWCWVPGRQSSERLLCLAARASCLVRLSRKFAGHTPPLQAALRLAMDLLPNAKELNDAQFAEAMRRVSTGETAWATATLTGMDVEAVADALLATLPQRLPDPNIGAIRFKLLRSLAAITDHGMRMGNCLAQPRHAMAYCGVPLALFEVSACDGPIATLALGFDQPRAGHGPRLVIAELKGSRNGKALYAVARAADHFQATLAFFNLDDWNRHLLAHAAWRAGYR